MTTTDDTTAAPEPATDEPTAELAPGDDEPATDEPTAEPSGNAEAAKYRTRLREAEAERDRLAGIVTGLRTTEAERAVAAITDTLGDPADLWTDGSVTLDDLLDDDGQVDAGKVETAVAVVLARHPSWAKQRPVLDLGQGARGASPSDYGSSDIGAAVRKAVRGER